MQKRLKLIEALKKDAADFAKKNKQTQKHSEKARADLELSRQVSGNLKASIEQLQASRPDILHKKEINALRAKINDKREVLNEIQADIDEMMK